MSIRYGSLSNNYLVRRDNLTAVFAFIRQSDRCLWPSISQKISRNIKNWNNKSKKKNFQQWWFGTVVCETGDISGLQEYWFIKSWKLVLRDRNRRTNQRDNVSHQYRCRWYRRLQMPWCERNKDGVVWTAARLTGRWRRRWPSMTHVRQWVVLWTMHDSPLW